MKKLYFQSTGKLGTYLHSPEGRIDDETIFLSIPKYKMEPNWYIFLSDTKNEELYFSSILMAGIARAKLNPELPVSGDLFLEGVSGRVLLRESVRKQIEKIA